MTPPAASPSLAGLDRALLEVRRLVNRPGYRRRLLGPLGRRVELSTVRVLQAVDQALEPPSIGAIAATLGIDPSTASRLVDLRVTEGLITRSADPGDRRRIVLGMTPAGRALLGELATSRITMLTEVTDGWEPAEIAALERLLLRLTADFATLEEPDRG